MSGGFSRFGSAYEKYLTSVFGSCIESDVEVLRNVAYKEYADVVCEDRSEYYDNGASEIGEDSANFADQWDEEFGDDVEEWINGYVVQNEDNVSVNDIPTSIEYKIDPETMVVIDTYDSEEKLTCCLGGNYLVGEDSETVGRDVRELIRAIPKYQELDVTGAFMKGLVIGPTQVTMSPLGERFSIMRTNNIFEDIVKLLIEFANKYYVRENQGKMYVVRRSEEKNYGPLVLRSLMECKITDVIRQKIINVFNDNVVACTVIRQIDVRVINDSKVKVVRLDGVDQLSGQYVISHCLQGYKKIVIAGTNRVRIYDSNYNFVEEQAKCEVGYAFLIGENERRERVIFDCIVACGMLVWNDPLEKRLEYCRSFIDNNGSYTIQKFDVDPLKIGKRGCILTSVGSMQYLSWSRDIIVKCKVERVELVGGKYGSTLAVRRGIKNIKVMNAEQRLYRGKIVEVLVRQNKLELLGYRMDKGVASNVADFQKAILYKTLRYEDVRKFVINMPLKVGNGTDPWGDSGQGIRKFAVTKGSADRRTGRIRL